MSMSANDVLFNFTGSATPVSATATFANVSDLQSRTASTEASLGLMHTMMHDVSAPYHYVACGSSAGVCNGADAIGASNGEWHEVSCCSDVPLGSFTRTSPTCPYASRKNAPLVCNATGDFQNSFGCGAAPSASNPNDDPNCNHNATFAQAWRFCHAVGARLCTLDEIRNDCTRGTGCAHDDDVMWTSTVSPPSPPPKSAASDAQVQGLLAQLATVESDQHYTVCGSGRYADCGADRMASSNGELHEVACCSNVPLTGFVKRTTTAVTTCPYASRGSGGNTSLVCSTGAVSGTVINSVECGTGADANCNQQATYEQAVAYCTAAGARLCTANEVLSSCTTSLGCGHDADMLWTSSAVPQTELVSAVGSLADETAKASGEAHYIACSSQDGITSCGLQQRSAYNDEEHEVACCSDQPQGAFVKLSSVCPYASRQGAPLVCSTDYPWANSKECGTGSEAQCNHNATFAQAMRFCAQAGSRLCTLEEILNQCTKGTGCAHDIDLVWTATPSPPPVPQAGYIACGSQNFVAQCPANFSVANATERHDVSCCSDVPLDGFVKRLPSCPYAARHQSPLECRTRGPAKNSYECGSGVGGDLADCNHQATLPMAKAYCEEVGARLCTLSEVTSQCTIGLGCNHDLDMVWTSDTPTE